MRSIAWTALPLALLFLGGPVGCGDDEPEAGTTIIREDDDGDADIEVDVDDDDGFEMDVDVDEDGNVSGEIQVDEDEP